MGKKRSDLDVKYISQFQNGDEEAFNIIYEFYSKHIYWMGLSFFSNEEKAKDLVQFVFLEVYQTIAKLREPEKFYAWINRIAYSRCRLMLRYEMKDSLHYSQDMEENILENMFPDQQSDDVLTHMQKEKIKEIIIEELEKLSPEYRTICYLRLFEDLSWTEISEIANVPSGTVSSYMARLRPKLKQALVRNGFTSASCLGMVALPNMVEYYVAFFEKRQPLDLGVSNVHTKVTKIKKVSKGVHMLAYGCITVASVLLATVVSEKQGFTNFFDTMEVNYAKILRVDYPSELTKESFAVSVETSNQNYDEIRMNDRSSLLVEQNGHYEITLKKDGKTIDTKTIQITNIDKDVPEVIKEIKTKNKVILQVEDKGSGVDYEKVSLVKDGVKYECLEVNERTQEFTVTTQGVGMYELKIPDMLGNIQKIEISVSK